MRKCYYNANNIIVVVRFFKCSIDVICNLFKMYCYNLYCLWYDSNKTAMKKIKIVHNNSLSNLDASPQKNTNVGKQET